MNTDIGVIRITFKPEQLQPVRPNQTIRGAKAEELIRFPEFRSARFVTGGIYFRLDEKNRERYLPDGLVYARSENGGLLSEAAPFTSGGYLLIDRDGRSKLIRASDFRLAKDGMAEYVCDGTNNGIFLKDIERQNSSSPENFADSCTYIDRFQIIVQSNLILVAGGQDDGNGNKLKSIRSAITYNKDGTMSIFATDGEVGKKDFADILIKAGVETALNLDGGPSVQVAEKLLDGTVKNWIDWSGTKVGS